jgi:hypothetical protein
MRGHYAALLLLSFACAAQPPPAAPASEDAPFIKLADRDLALVVYFAGEELRPGEQEDLERRIASRLKTSYRTPVHSYRRSGAFVRFVPELLVDLANKGVDDVVIVEIAAEQLDLHGHVQVISLFDGKVLVDKSIKASESRGMPPIAKLADLVWLSVTRNFTDPGATPELDLAAVADRLYEDGACKQAVPLYAKGLSLRRGQSMSEVRLYNDRVDRNNKCRYTLQVAEEIERDKRAVFSLVLETQDLSPKVEDAVRTTLRNGVLEKKMRAESAKPVILRVTPAGFVLSARFDPKRHREIATESPEPAISLIPFYEMMFALSAFREEVADAASDADGEVLRELPLRLRLTKPGGDQATMDFATLDDRALTTGVIRVKLGTSNEIFVETASKKLVRDGIFVLGPASDDNGALTAYGVLYKFLEMTP